ncbi:MAG: hypothetical protein WCD08_05190 [Steroidobacteraceae bacterium]
MLKLVTDSDVAKPGRARLHPHRLSQLRFYLYTVEGRLEHVRQTFRVVCCHGSDARAMIVRRWPAIDKLKVTRGKPVDFIALGDHLLHQ